MSVIPDQVPCVPIAVISLSLDGLLPSSIHGAMPATSPFACRHLPPTNHDQHRLLSMWVNTHQAMFVATGISAHCVFRLADALMTDADRDTMASLVELAVDCRLSSAAYTSLPWLTRPLYEAYIRKSMMQVHPGFSGVSNQEAITMERALRSLKRAHDQLFLRNRKQAEALLPVLDRLYAADKSWWRFHGKAMGKYVSNPVSLARMDFKNQALGGSGDADFQTYRDRVLRQTEAIADYDAYFAVRRRHDLCLDHYEALLAHTLECSAPYVEQTGVLATYRARGAKALQSVIDLEKSAIRSNAQTRPSILPA
jgi:hypothetical protein